MEKKMIEKRRCHRLQIELPVLFKTSEEQSHVSMGLTHDISGIGLNFSSKEKLLVGQEVPIYIKISSTERVLVNTKVMWVKEFDILGTEEYLVGVRILEEMKSEELKFIQFFVQKFIKYFQKE